jgi:hypothetical protein
VARIPAEDVVLVPLDIHLDEPDRAIGHRGHRGVHGRDRHVASATFRAGSHPVVPEVVRAHGEAARPDGIPERSGGGGHVRHAVQLQVRFEEREVAPLRLEGVDASGRADELAHEQAMDADVGADVQTHSTAEAHGRQ